MDFYIVFGKLRFKEKMIGFKKGLLEQYYKKKGKET